MANLFQETGEPMLSNLLRILILTQLFVVSFLQQGCIQCEVFNRVTPQGCAQDYTQCGGCLPNFIEDTEDPRICFALDILNEADDKVTQEVDSEVYLVCKFNALVSCKWSKDGVEVKDIGPESNRQWSRGSEENTKDCSLTIRHLREEDVGSWVCRSRASSNFNELSSKPMKLYIKPTLLRSPDKFYKVVEGSSVTLACVFDHKVVCYWTKNGRPMNSNENYQFTKNSTDCSLTIGNATAGDSGKWKCVALGTSNRDRVSSPQTNLKVTRAKIQESPLIYYGDEVVNGATLMFPGEQAMAKLRCQMPNMASGYSLWWVLDNDEVYQEHSKGLLKVGPELGRAMVKQLQKQNEIELICMALHEFKQMSIAKVTISDIFNKTEVTATASNYGTVFIMLSAFTATAVFAIVAFGTIIFILMRRKSNSKRKDYISLQGLNMVSKNEVQI